VNGGDGYAGLAARLAEFAAQRDFSGLARISVAGATAFEACYGLANRADGVPVRPGTRFGLASVTKMFTAVTVAGLVGAGMLSFERPVIDILPPERRPSTLRADVTLAHLLSHLSGIADYFEEQADQPGDYADLWAGRPTYAMRRPADFLPLFGELAPYRPPGERFQYSNAGYVLLGLVIEEIAQAPYTEVVTQRVFDRANMPDSGFFALDEARPDVAVGYRPPAVDGGPWRSNIFTIPIIGGADGGAFSNAADLDRFLRAYDDGTLLGTTLRDAMLTPRADMGNARPEGLAPEQADPAQGTLLRGPAGPWMGYGVVQYGAGRTRRFGHGGGDPGVEVYVMRFPELDVNGIVLGNTEGLAGQVRDLLVEAVVAAA
jgi:CubicO group peptidase (beta-lactamase class C family)